MFSKPQNKLTLHLPNTTGCFFLTVVALRLMVLLKIPMDWSMDSYGDASGKWLTDPLCKSIPTSLAEIEGSSQFRKISRIFSLFLHFSPSATLRLKNECWFDSPRTRAWSHLFSLLEHHTTSYIPFAVKELHPESGSEHRAETAPHTYLSVLQHLLHLLLKDESY